MAQLYSPKELATLMQGQLHGQCPENLLISFLLNDSRRISFAGSSVFFALKTAKNDGHLFIEELLQKGVKCFVVSSLPKAKSMQNSACFILVDDTLEALQKLAASHRNQFDCPVVGITGSNGKTIVKEWLTQLLAPDCNIVKNPRSYNSQVGVPLSVWNMDASHQLAVFEAGISRQGEMEKLAAIIRPTVGIFTNIGPAHDEGFPDTETKIMEKLRLFENCSMLVFNSDQKKVKRCIYSWAKAHPDVQLFSWGHNEDDDLIVLGAGSHDSFQMIEVEFEGEVYPFHTPFADKASVENLLHCIAFIFSFDLYHFELPERTGRLSSVAMRMEMKHAVNNCFLINDAYSSDILSLDVSLDFLTAQSRQRVKVLILSDILQSGLPPDELYRKVARMVKQKDIELLIGIGEEISAHQKRFAGISCQFFSSTESFLEDFDFSILRGMGILLKGARDFGFERISNKLQLRDHQTVLEINLDALIHNLNVYRGMLKPGTRVMAMVKAFSYGSGSFEIANLLQFHRVDCLAVAFADEGNELRSAGISLPIVVLNPELHNLDILFRYNLEPEIYSLQLLQRLANEVTRFPFLTPESPFPVHIKLDTGMHRLGFMESELDEMLRLLKNTPALRVESVFSHLAASDRPEFDAFSREQLDVFERMTQKLEQALGYSFLRHMANSAAISRFPEAHFDMVRVGIGLYGVDGSPQTAKLLQNVTTFKSVISQIKDLPSGESVGYNRAAILTRNTRIAIVPVGYADGLNRKLGNGKGYMLVNGKKAPILGNISMDMCCLDVTEMDVEEGDEVIIFGEHLPVHTLAQNLETIPYEIFTSIPPRVKRVYFSE